LEDPSRISEDLIEKQDVDKRVRSLTDGAKLTWESVVDVGASSSSIPGNGARKLAAGAWLMAPEDSLCVVNDQPVGNPKRKV
jgi:hypothetical protein